MASVGVGVEEGVVVGGELTPSSKVVDCDWNGDGDGNEVVGGGLNGDERRIPIVPQARPTSYDSNVVAVKIRSTVRKVLLVSDVMGRGKSVAIMRRLGWSSSGGSNGSKCV